MKLFVGSSASQDISNKYLDDCEKYLDELLKDNDLLFGASDKGLMGISYKSARKNDRRISAILPKIYEDSLIELQCDENIITSNMIESTTELIKKCDAMIFIPGGFGTMYELFIALQLKICGEHNKPIIIYNSCGFYDNLCVFIEKLFDEKFAKKYVHDMYHISSSAEDTIKYLNI